MIYSSCNGFEKFDDCETPVLTLDDQILIHANIFLSHENRQHTVRLLDELTSTLRSSYEDTDLLRNLKRVNERCGIKRRTEPDQDSDILSDLRTYHLLCRGSEQNKQQRAKIEAGWTAYKRKQSQHHSTSHLLDSMLLTLRPGIHCFHLNAILPIILLSIIVYGHEHLSSFVALYNSVREWLELYKKFQNACDPIEFRRPGYLNTKWTDIKLEEFEIIPFHYKTVHASRETLRLKLGVFWARYIRLWDLEHIDLQPKLQLYICVPKHLLNSLRNDKEKVGVIIGTTGGGMTTGHPIDPVWTADAILEAAQRHNCVYITWERRMLPESAGSESLEDADDFFSLMIEDGFVERILSSAGYNFRVCQRNMTLTAESAGAMFAVRWLLQYPERISGAYLRSPLVDEYIRKPGVYMGRKLELSEVQRDAYWMFRCLVELNGELPPAKSRPTPEYQYIAVCLASAHIFDVMWDADLSIDLLRRWKAPAAGVSCRVHILHGTDDDLVPLSSSEILAKMLQEKGFRVELTPLLGEKHCTDYNYSLDIEKMSPVRSFLSEIC